MCFNVYYKVVPVMLHNLNKISTVRLYLPKDLRSSDNRLSVDKSIEVNVIDIQYIHVYLYICFVNSNMMYMCCCKDLSLGKDMCMYIYWHIKLVCANCM